MTKVKAKKNPGTKEANRISSMEARKKNRTTIRRRR
jgi:hypothetical protein